MCLCVYPTPGRPGTDLPLFTPRSHDKSLPSHDSISPGYAVSPARHPGLPGRGSRSGGASASGYHTVHICGSMAASHTTAVRYVSSYLGAFCARVITICCAREADGGHAVVDRECPG